MEKLVFLLWRPDGVSGESVRDRFLGETADRLLSEGALAISANFTDIDEEARSTLFKPRPGGDGREVVAGTVSLWVDCVDESPRHQRVLTELTDRLEGYLVTESVPRALEPRDWPDGVRTPGVSLVTFLAKPESLPYGIFIQRWHGSHTPLSLEVHPLWAYVRNAVARRLTPDAPDFLGIVEEQFLSIEDVSDPDRFFSSQEDQKRAMEDAKSFLDLSATEFYLMSQYIMKSF